MSHFVYRGHVMPEPLDWMTFDKGGPDACNPVRIHEVIRVEKDDNVSRSSFYANIHRGCLTLVPLSYDGNAVAELVEHGGRLVGATVVDHDHLTLSSLSKCGRDALSQESPVVVVVDDDAHMRLLI